MFPRALGVALIAGGVCYLVDVLAAFVVPDLGGVQQVYAFVVVSTTAITGISMVIYLLVIRVKDSEVGQTHLRRRASARHTAQLMGTLCLPPPQP
jgi:hypothetical protein